MTIIDAHQHYWDTAELDYGWDRQGLPQLDRSYLPAELEPQMAEAGVTSSILVQVLDQAAETRWMLDLAARAESIAGVVGWVDLTQPPERVAADLRAVMQHPELVGIRHLVHEEPDEDWLARADVADGLAVLAGEDIPFDLLLRPQHLRHVPELSDRHPHLRMVIDHLAKPHIAAGLREPWARGMAAAAENPNVFCKVSGMVTEADHATWSVEDLAPYVEVVLEAFGPSRLMFGSDWPVCTLAGSYGQVIGALRTVLGAVDPATEADIFHRTAQQFYLSRRSADPRSTTEERAQ